MKIIKSPDNTWVTRLRRGHFVYAVKEKRFAKIEWAFEPPEPGCYSGRIGLRFCHVYDEDSWGVDSFCHTWYIYEDGTGFDGKDLLVPVEGNCPDIAAPISEPWIRQTERALLQLNARLDQIQSELSYIKGIFKE